MSEDTAGSTGGANAQDIPAEISKMKDEMDKMSKHIKEQESFIGKQSTEIGELRKKVETKPDGSGNAETTKPEAGSAEKGDAKPFFETLDSSGQEAVKAYMQKQLAEMEPERAAELRENMDDKTFNLLAEEIHAKLKKPKYIEEIFGGKQSDGGREEAKSEFMQKAKTLFKLLDSQQGAGLPEGGTSSQGAAKPAQQGYKPSGNYPDGGILSMTRTKNKK